MNVQLHRYVAPIAGVFAWVFVRKNVSGGRECRSKTDT